jgi:CheY-like chemotaxis protein
MRLGGPPETRARILLIEDDDETAAYVENGLEEDGHAVERARDGTHGPSLATTEAFDVIVVDRLLPIIDGLTVVKMLRAGLRASNSPAPQHHVPAGTADHRRRRPLRTLRAAAAAPGQRFGDGARGGRVADA